MLKLRIRYFLIRRKRVSLISLRVIIDDQKTRAFIDLRFAKVKYSNKSIQGENFIKIQKDQDVIILAFENVREFEKWSTVFKAH